MIPWLTTCQELQYSPGLKPRLFSPRTSLVCKLWQAPYRDSPLEISYQIFIHTLPIFILQKFYLTKIFPKEIFTLLKFSFRLRNFTVSVNRLYVDVTLRQCGKLISERRDPFSKTLRSISSFTFPCITTRDKTDCIFRSSAVSNSHTVQMIYK